jgi:hypothetical protein
VIWRAVLAFLLDLIKAVAGSPATAPAAPALTIGKTPITFGQLRDAVHAAPSFVGALTAIVQGKGTVADDEVVADDAIALALALAGPEAAPFAAIAPTLANLFIEGLASGAIKGGSGANDDPLGRGGRRQ